MTTIKIRIWREKSIRRWYRFERVGYAGGYCADTIPDWVSVPGYLDILEGWAIVKDVDIRLLGFMSLNVKRLDGM